MAIIKQDSFTAAVTPELLSAHTSDVGGGYAGDLLQYMWEIDPSGTLQCSSESERVAWGNENPTTADYETTVTGRTLDAAAAAHFGVGVRGDGLEEYQCTGYVAAVQGDGNLRLFRYNAGVVTVLGTYAIPGFGINTLYTLRMRVTGSNPIECVIYLDDTVVLTYSDGSVDRVTASGNGGLYSRFGAVTRCAIYSLLVEDLAGAGPNTAPAVTAFAVDDDSLVDTTVVTITAFTGTDTEDVNVAGYAITESSTPPSASTSATPIATYDLGSYRSATLYPWVFDSAGLVSAAYGSPIAVIAASSLGGGTTTVFGNGFGGGITS